MTSFYLSPPSPLPHVEGNQGQDHLFFTSTSQTSSYSCPVYFNASQEQGDYDEYHHQQQQHKHEIDDPFSTGGWSGEHNFVPRSFPTVDDHHYNNNNKCIKPSICKREDRHSDSCNNAPVKWMSSKMRLMKKMMNSDRSATNKTIRDAQTCPDDPRSPPCDYNKSSNSTNNVIRVCADCNTTKTPLWRSGPTGPKSLCNACGIRQRKARRALAAATAAANGGLVPTDPSMNSKVPKEKRSDSDYTTQYKKRCKLAGPRTKKKLRFDDFTVSLSKNSAFHRVFPQDEKDAAILLMALSCGLVRG